MDISIRSLDELSESIRSLLHRQGDHHHDHRFRPRLRINSNARLRDKKASTNVQDDDDGHPRILALHGARSNYRVTTMQLENLGLRIILNDDANANHHAMEDNDSKLPVEVVHLHGSIPMEEGHPDIANLFHGPYYSWFLEETKGRRKDAIRRSILSNVRDVLKVIETQGPFDGIYGFSSGAALAALVASYPV